ncbi:hypothetical protein I3842_04G169400 [Carya illinoinensis]|uniref:Uncharacterized protein n=1 Tax=Carya illinoinensis TaxID=32201 RepID=A0A922JWB7_CARIL|nr:hypothetical protein I3842_04G169400 [Carya illinoinensis]
MRQRHSQGHASLAVPRVVMTLRMMHAQGHVLLSPASPRSRTWIEILENFLWLASATFTIYCGDRHSNLIYLLWHDNRIRRFSFALWPIWSFLTLLVISHAFLFSSLAFQYFKFGNCLISSHFYISHCLWLAWLYSPTF